MELNLKTLLAISHTGHDDYDVLLLLWWFLWLLQSELYLLLLLTLTALQG